MHSVIIKDPENNPINQSISASRFKRNPHGAGRPDNRHRQVNRRFRYTHIDNPGNFRAIVPSGAFTRANEAVELRDGGPAYSRKCVETAVQNVERVIAPALVKSKLSLATDQKQIDALLRS